MSDNAQRPEFAAEAGATHPMDPALRAALAAALEWQIEAGVDASVCDAPVNQFAAQPSPLAAARTSVDAKERPARAAAAPADSDHVDPQALAQDARRAAQSAGDLEALKAALEAFEGSSLKAGAKNCVFADGVPGAALMVIGEGPGKDEDRIGKPFVGRSGQLLDRMLASIGLSRSAETPQSGAYIANLVPWRPLGNRTPDDQEVTILLPFLERHIALARPKVILCVGAPAAKHVMGAKSGITKFRGSWIEYGSAGEPIPCLSTLHPAYLLRSPEMKRFAWRDLLALRARLDALNLDAPNLDEPNKEQRE